MRECSKIATTHPGLSPEGAVRMEIERLFPLCQEHSERLGRVETSVNQTVVAVSLVDQRLDEMVRQVDGVRRDLARNTELTGSVASSLKDVVADLIARKAFRRRVTKLVWAVGTGGALALATFIARAIWAAVTGG